jgi:DNA-directed RNA polymerase alpha subunit
MEIQLINGLFSDNETLELIRNLINVKIKFHEDKIDFQHNIEDIKTREAKIKFLQQQLDLLKKMPQHYNSTNKIEATIHIN